MSRHKRLTYRQTPGNTMTFGEKSGYKPKYYKDSIGEGFFDKIKDLYHRYIPRVKEVGNAILNSELGQQAVNYGINQLSQKIENKQEMPERRYINSDKMPSTNTLQKMANRAYEGYDSSPIDGWAFEWKTPTLLFYKKGNVICIAIRGTETNSVDDLGADANIVMGSLETSKRYKEDLETIKMVQRKLPPTQYYYIGVGHSLGGALLDKFILNGYIQEGVSFNPAIDKNDYLVNTKNRRIYLKNDPLYNMMGKYALNHEVRNTNLSPLQAHSINNFVGGKMNQIIEEKLDSIFGSGMSEQYKKWAERRKPDLQRMQELQQKDPEEYKRELERRNAAHEEARANMLVYNSPEYKKMVDDMKYEKYLQEHPSMRTFDNINKGLTSVADFIIDNPVTSNIVPGWAKTIYKNFGPPDSKFQQGSGLVGLFRKRLDGMGLNAETYLQACRRIAEKAGYDATKLHIATDNKHKLYYEVGRKKIHFGSAVNNDYILWNYLEMQGKAPIGTADKKRKVFHASHGKMKGEWKNNKFSKNNLALRIIW